jgi:hypothetical protein
MDAHQALPQSTTTVVATIEDLRNRYRRRAKWHRMWFRSTGVMVIVLSTSLPALTIPDYGAKKALISAVGVTIALLTGLRNFFQWDQLWSLLRQSDFELSYLLDKWTLDTEAASELSSAERAGKLHELAAALRDAAEEVRRSESTRYFGSLRFPHSSG